MVKKTVKTIEQEIAVEEPQEKKLTFLERIAIKRVVRNVKKNIALVKEKKVWVKEQKVAEEIRKTTIQLIKDNEIDITDEKGHLYTVEEISKMNTEQQIEIQEEILRGLEELLGIEAKK